MTITKKQNKTNLAISLVFRPVPTFKWPGIWQLEAASGCPRSRTRENDHSLLSRTIHFVTSSETQGQIVGTRESLNGRKNVALRKVKNGEKIRLSKKSFVGFHMAPFFTFPRVEFFLWVVLLINVWWVDIYFTLTICLTCTRCNRGKWIYSLRIDSAERFAFSFMYRNTQFRTKTQSTFRTKKVDSSLLVRLHRSIKVSLKHSKQLMHV